MAGLDFNNASTEQNAGAGSPIPPESIVWVQLHIRYPEESQRGSDPAFTRARSGIEQINTELEVIQGKFKGKQIFHRFSVAGAVTPGQQKAVRISMAQLRALVEVHRGVTPDDASPKATEARKLNDVSELEGMKFPIRVACEKSNQVSKHDQTKYYVNNALEAVVTVTDPEWEAVHKAPFEVITDNPIPEFSVTTPPAASWNSAPAQSSGDAPSWGQSNAGPVPPAGGQPWGTNTDTVPF